MTQALGPNPISVDRVVRSAVIARDCGADIAVVLTKADRAGASMLQTDVALIQEVLGQDVRIVATSAGASRRRAAADLRDAANRCGSGWGEDDVRGIVPAGTVAIVLGESGAGKSTLLNALLGREALETGAVRMSDDMGRHTTVARRMVSLPGAGVIVDEPGLRSLPLVGHERGLAKVFPEIAEAAWSCRFRDCMRGEVCVRRGEVLKRTTRCIRFARLRDACQRKDARSGRSVVAESDIVVLHHSLAAVFQVQLG